MIKKISITFAIMLFATSAYAGTPSSNLKGFAQSKNVTIDYAKAPANCTNGCDRWAANSQHSSADKNYFTSSAFGGLAIRTVLPGSTQPTATAPNTSTDSAIASGWSVI